MRNINKRLIVLVTALIMSLIIPMWQGTTIEAKAKKVRLNYTMVTVKAGSSIKLKVRGTSKKVKWKTSNKKIATVSKKGKVTGKKAGKCTITAKVKNKKLKCKVVVKKVKVKKSSKFTATTLSLSSLKLNVKDIDYSADGKAVFADRAGTFKLKVLNGTNAVWSTSNSAVATVTNGEVTAVAAGNCTISATVAGKNYTCALTVTNFSKPQLVEEQKVIYEMVGYVNQNRVKVKVAPLKIKDELNSMAAIRAKEVASSEKNFSHTRPNGTPYKTAYAEVGMKAGSYVGENVAYTMDNVKNMADFTKMSFDNIYNSEAHRVIMENPNYEYIGIGYKNAGLDTSDNGAVGVETYWVQEFYTK